MSHITGGGLANNLARVLPDNLGATVDRATWTPAPIFDLVQQVGKVSQPDIEATLNMGVGMVAVVAAGAADEAVAHLGRRGVPSWILGEVTDTPGGNVEMIGQHAKA